MEPVACRPAGATRAGRAVNLGKIRSLEIEADQRGRYCVCYVFVFYGVSSPSNKHSRGTGEAPIRTCTGNGECEEEATRGEALVETKGEQNSQRSQADNFDRMEMKQYSRDYARKWTDIRNFGKAAECEGAGARWEEV